MEIPHSKGKTCNMNEKFYRSVHKTPRLGQDHEILVRYVEHIFYAQKSFATKSLFDKWYGGILYEQGLALKWWFTSHRDM